MDKEINCRNYIIKYHINSYYDAMGILIIYVAGWLDYNGKENRQSVQFICDDYFRIRYDYAYLPKYIIKKLENICRKELKNNWYKEKEM